MMRPFIVILVALLAPIVSAADGPPNILLIVSDDQRWTDFGFMGHETIRTPHLDKLAKEGVLFTNGYTPTSLCRASLATILTGLYGHQHRICCNDPPQGMDRSAMLPFLKDAPTIPRLLQQKSYRSLQTGKFWEGHFSNGGFTHGMTTNPPRDPANPRSPVGRHGDHGLKIGRQGLQPIYDFIEQGQRDAQPGQPPAPFFIWYAPMMPHLPHNPPQRLLQKYTAPGRGDADTKYFAMCEWFDETVEELLAYLERNNLRDNTLVVFCVDNGWINGPAPRGDPRAKSSPYDAGVRTPIIISWPGHTKPARYDDLASTLDIAPTVLNAAGLAPTNKMQGINLLPRTAGGAPLDRTTVHGEIYVHTAKDLKSIPINLTHQWIRDGQWKLIVPSEADGPPELYDVVADPHEQTNLASRHPDTVTALRAKITARPLE